ncbi:RNP domain-containing protein [Cryptococcus deuterogattii R265]|uniref:RNP domain-containing protein n=1 Tax=Cryptococcus deuterogattii (strain R265) TaxID=294750 RepID=UPI001936AAD1|nr:RNP domain-containing protein [Cryptococcus deuterogattii R265]
MEDDREMRGDEPMAPEAGDRYRRDDRDRSRSRERHSSRRDEDRYRSRRRSYSRSRSRSRTRSPHRHRHRSASRSRSRSRDRRDRDRSRSRDRGDRGERRSYREDRHGGDHRGSGRPRSPDVVQVGMVRPDRTGRRVLAGL